MMTIQDKALARHLAEEEQKRNRHRAQAFREAVDVCRLRAARLRELGDNGSASEVDYVSNMFSELTDEAEKG